MSRIASHNQPANPPPARPSPSGSGDFDGLLLVDKPAGMTSHDVVARIRRTFRIKKVGHGGTLDPNATGLLVILLGKGTSLSNEVMGATSARGEMLLGTETDSQDIDGQVVATLPFDLVTAEQLQARMNEFVGDNRRRQWSRPSRRTAYRYTTGPQRPDSRASRV